MAVFTCVKTGKASESATWDKGAETPGSTSECIIPTGKEVKFEANLSIVNLLHEGTGKSFVTKQLTFTGEGKPLKLVDSNSLTCSGATAKIAYNPGNKTAEIESKGIDFRSLGLNGTANSKYSLQSTTKSNIFQLLVNVG